MRDLKQFHDAFPSFEKEFQKEQEKEKKKGDDYRIEQFRVKYPDLDSTKLVQLKVFTDDGCSHYKHTENNKVYSWYRYSNPHWIDNDESTQLWLLTRAT
jgi:hypothetical protein